MPISTVDPGSSDAIYAYFGSVLVWIIVGIVSGVIARISVGSTGQGFLLDILFGIVVAVVGGYVSSAVGPQGITGFNPFGMFIAVAGAILLIWIYHSRQER